MCVLVDAAGKSGLKSTAETSAYAVGRDCWTISKRMSSLILAAKMPAEAIY
jgi:hypothetical protein